jgi:putative Mg2+ transporter-C (MgtC) family protein
LTGFVLAGNTLLRPLVNAINRIPINEGATEAIYEVRITTSGNHLDEGRELLREQLEAANYPLQRIEVIDRENDGVELLATLLGTAANPRELDEIVSHLDRNPHVESASWSLRTTE